jgi:predicted TIM-barrel fold metal-dependent hydrolase
MIIDFHTHIGDLRMDITDPYDAMTWEDLIAYMDEEGVDKAVFLPVYNVSPEDTPPGIAVLDSRMSVRDLILDAGRYPERIIPFGNMDPRWLRNDPHSDFTPILDWFLEHGCKGIGEVTANLPFDDPRVINMFQQIGAKGLMVTIESSGMTVGPYGLQDDPGAPRLERLLQAAPETVVIGHGPGFWAEMGADISPEDKWDYPKGPITKEGATWRLLRIYPNMYADLSAQSGFNALTRDPEAGVRFLNEFQDKLLFGTDNCFKDPAKRNPHLRYLKELRDSGKITSTVFDKIAGLNAQKLLGLL